MKTDLHVHTSFSGDSDASPESMIEAAIKCGLETICITDHLDEDFTEPEFEIDFSEYFSTLKGLQEKYKGKIDVRIGMEYGFQSHLGKSCREIVKKHPFDFVIGSMHLLNGEDVYYGKCFEYMTDEEVYRKMFESTLECIQNVTDFDVLGHIDYVVRYGNEQEKAYSYEKFADIIDAILKHLISNGKGLEINTAGWKYGLPFAHPHVDVLKRYQELGGKILTIGSDAHKPEHVAYDFHKVSDVLRACGFKYYTEFKQRKAIFRQLP